MTYCILRLQILTEPMLSIHIPLPAQYVPKSFSERERDQGVKITAHLLLNSIFFLMRKNVAFIDHRAVCMCDECHPTSPLMQLTDLQENRYECCAIGGKLNAVVYTSNFLSSVIITSRICELVITNIKHRCKAIFKICMRLSA